MQTERLLDEVRVFSEDEGFRHERLFAWSHDGGTRWVDPDYHAVIPDGPRYRGEERRGACYNGHFGMMARFNLSWLLNGEATGEGPLPEWPGV